MTQITLGRGQSQVARLVNRLSCNTAIYRSPAYNEKVRLEFINPFFKALSWGVQNRRGRVPQYRLRKGEQSRIF